MPRIIINGEAMDIPADEATGREIKTLARMEPEQVLYVPAAPGRPAKVIDEDEPVKLVSGVSLNSLRPFLTGGEARRDDAGTAGALPRARVCVQVSPPIPPLTVPVSSCGMIDTAAVLFMLAAARDATRGVAGLSQGGGAASDGANRCSRGGEDG